MTRHFPPSTFDDDLLQREELADYLTNFINSSYPSSNENSLVFALDSPWGTGKTCFINMWIDKLKNHKEPKYNIINYNAWENDDCPDAIIPLICSFSQLLGDSPEVADSQKKTILNVIKVFTPRIANGLLRKFTGIDGSELLEACSEFRDMNDPNTIYSEYTSLNEKKERFRELVEIFSSKNEKLLIFIDELDRCRPTYAIETLEVVKHFFDLDNVIFIFSTDIVQLSHSISTIYGDIDCVGYLQRFFDKQIKLPVPSLNAYLEKRLITSNGKFLEMEADYLSLLVSRLSLSYRDINIICDEYVKFYNQKYAISFDICGNDYYGLRKVYLSLYCLKYTQPLLYLTFTKRGTWGHDKEPIWQRLFPDDKDVGDFFSYSSEGIMIQPLYHLLNDTPQSNDETLTKRNYFFNAEYEKVDPNSLKKMTIIDAVYNNIEYKKMFTSSSISK
ncbi:MAG: P-loop NTPase fold protein [Methanocorpusculum sp.]|uniref:KAP family P-loop NTPase fold protein n=1 Tax=Methanocorpusculum sp. TaxID=2058474 RepID=UPI002728ED9B|nr:P-loop NTPase fold protein [Methanocorpusculum sp.]MDO9522585.1 P-loop NTPase fold protein [Methanocorpusculum sp.]